MGNTAARDAPKDDCQTPNASSSTVPGPGPSKMTRNSPMYSLKPRSRDPLKETSPDPGLKTPEVGPSTNADGQRMSSGRKSSGRYKIAQEKSDIVAESHPLFEILTPPPRVADAELNNRCRTSMQLDPFNFFRKIQLEMELANGGEEEQKECILNLAEQDRKRQSDIELKLAQRSEVLKALGEDKERLLRQYEEERRRAEQEKRQKIAVVDALVQQGSVVKINMQELDDLTQFLRKYEGETELLGNDLAFLKLACENLLSRIRDLKESIESIDSRQLTDELVDLFDEQKRLLAERLRSDSSSAGANSMLVEWAFGKLRNVKVPFTELSLRQADAYREREKAACCANFSPFKDSLRAKFEILNKDKGSVFGALNLGLFAADEIAKGQNFTAEVFQFLCTTLDQIQETPTNQPGTISKLATSIFSACRFMSNLPVNNQDDLGQLLMQALHARCDLCIPTFRDKNSFNPQMIFLFSTLIALAGYVPPSSIKIEHMRCYWTVAKRPYKSRLPFSVVDGWQWLVRSGRLLSQSVQKILSSQSSSQSDRHDMVNTIIEAEQICRALNIFLHCAAHAMLVALSPDSGILRMLESLKNLAQQASKQVGPAKELITVIEKILAQPSWFGGLRIMNQEPAAIPMLLEMSHFWRVCDSSIISYVEGKKTQFQHSISQDERECYEVIVQVDKINLNAEIDREGKWLSVFLQRYTMSFKHDGWKHLLEGRTLDSYCLNRLCSRFTSKFSSETFRVNKSATYINGIIDLCKDPNLEKRLFAFYLKMHFYQTCPMLIPVLESDSLEQQSLGVEKMVGVFALLVYSSLLHPNVWSPFNSHDGWCWFANILNLWRMHKGNPDVEKFCANILREFLRPGGDTDGFDPRPWYQSFRTTHYRPLIQVLSDFASMKVVGVSKGDPAADAFRRVLDTIRTQSLL